MVTTATVTRGFTFATGVEADAASLNQLGEPTVTIPSISATSVTLENKTVNTTLVVLCNGKNSCITQARQMLLGAALLVGRTYT